MVLKYIPTYPMGYSIASLVSAKREMDNKKKAGFDNYAHRLGMCESAKNGYVSAGTSLVSGAIKEVIDCARKTGKIGLKKAVSDSIKDMKNNIEGLSYGLKGDGKSCREWLGDLNYKTNEWRKK